MYTCIWGEFVELGPSYYNLQTQLLSLHSQDVTHDTTAHTVGWCWLTIPVTADHDASEGSKHFYETQNDAEYVKAKTDTLGLKLTKLMSMML